MPRLIQPCHRRAPTRRRLCSLCLRHPLRHSPQRATALLLSDCRHKTRSRRQRHMRDPLPSSTLSTITQEPHLAIRAPRAVSILPSHTRPRCISSIGTARISRCGMSIPFSTRHPRLSCNNTISPTSSRPRRCTTSRWGDATSCALALCRNLPWLVRDTWEVDNITQSHLGHLGHMERCLRSCRGLIRGGHCMQPPLDGRSPMLTIRQSGDGIGVPFCLPRDGPMIGSYLYS